MAGIIEQESSDFSTILINVAKAMVRFYLSSRELKVVAIKKNEEL
jgi:hypothetical protein